MAVVRSSVDDSGFLELRGLVADIRHRVTRAVERDARRYVPKDTWELEESLRSIYTSPAEDSDYVTVGTDHWPYPEFGVMSRPRYPRQPYMRPALYQVRDLGSP